MVHINNLIDFNRELEKEMSRNNLSMIEAKCFIDVKEDLNRHIKQPWKIQRNLLIM